MNALTPIGEGRIPVSWAGSPFGAYRGDVYHDVMPAGVRTIDQMVEYLGDRLPVGFREYGVACVNNEPVPRQMWAYVRPRVDGPLPVVVTFMIRPSAGGGGGAGGGKNIFATIASIALLAAVTFLSAGTGAFLGASLFGSFTVGKALALGVGLIGSLLVKGLSSTPSRQDQQTNNRKESAAAQGNVLSPGAPIPMVVGTYRVFPPLIAEPLVELVDGDETVTATYCLAGPHYLANIRLGQADIEEDTNVEVETRQGWDNDTALTLHTRVSRTEAPQLELSPYKILGTGTISDGQTTLLNQTTPTLSIPKFHRLTSGRSPDKVWIHLYFPQGLADSAALTTVKGIPFRIRIRQRGTATWINLPEIHYRSHQTDLIRTSINIIWGTAPTFVTPVTDYGWALAYKLTVAQAATPAASAWTADSSFSSGAGSNVMSSSGAGNVLNVRLYDDRAEFYLNPNVFPKDVYEIEIQRGGVYTNTSWNVTNYTYGGNIRDPFWYFTSASVHYTAFHAINSLVSASFIARIVSVWDEHPVGGTGLALITVQAVNRQLDQLSVLASGYVETYQASPGIWSGYETTSNPAPHFRNALRGTQNKRALSDAQIDEDSLTAWFLHCEDKGYQVNAILENTSLAEALQLMAGCGYARPTKSETWGVMIDKDRSGELPVQIFTPRNMNNFRWTKGFPVLPHYLIASYRDADRDYSAKQLIIYADGYSAGGSPGIQGTLPESVAYEGLVTEAEIQARGTFDLAQGTARAIFYSGDTGPENLVCRRGDLVGVQHETLKRQAGFARIKAIILENDLIVGLELDSKVPIIMPDDGPVGIAIRRRDDSISLRQLDTTMSPLAPDGYTDTVYFTAGFADPGEDILGEDCLIATGPVGEVYRRLIVVDIRPSRNLMANVTMVDEASEIFPPPVVPEDIIIPIIADEFNLNLKNLYDDLGYDEPAAGRVIIFDIAAGVTIGSSTALLSALTTGTWPAGVVPKLRGEGRVQGAGGGGGNGDNAPPLDDTTIGQNGGTALEVTSPIDIDWAAGELFGGGGGGGGGYNSFSNDGGGGGAGTVPGNGGVWAGGGENGDPGTADAGGQGGETPTKGVGGDGGDPGEMGGPGYSITTTYPDSSGGFAGLAIDGEDLVTFTAAPTIKGLPGGVNFSGTQWLTRGAGLTGAADSKRITIVALVNLTGAAGTSQRILSAHDSVGGGTDTEFTMWYSGPNQNLQVQARNAAGTVILDINSGAVSPLNAGWTVILISIPLDTPASTRMYFNNTSVLTSVTQTNDNVDWTNADWSLGARADGSLPVTGDIAYLQMWLGEYVDFSNSEYRLPFISAAGVPRAPRGLDTHFASTPKISFWDGPTVTEWAVNQGGGGAFTLNGTLTRAKTHPAG